MYICTKINGCFPGRLAEKLWKDAANVDAACSKWVEEEEVHMPKLDKNLRDLVEITEISTEASRHVQVTSSGRPRGQRTRRAPNSSDRTRYFAEDVHLTGQNWTLGQRFCGNCKICGNWWK